MYLYIYISEINYIYIFIYVYLFIYSLLNNHILITDYISLYMIGFVLSSWVKCHDNGFLLLCLSEFIITALFSFKPHLHFYLLKKSDGNHYLGLKSLIYLFTRIHQTVKSHHCNSYERILDLQSHIGTWKTTSRQGFYKLKSGWYHYHLLVSGTETVTKSWLGSSGLAVFKVPDSYALSVAYSRKPVNVL